MQTRNTTKEKERCTLVSTSIFFFCDGPWWSEQLATMKKAVATKRRRVRCAAPAAAPVRRAMVVDEYLKPKDKHELEAMKAQTESWKSFCEKQDREGVWEDIPSP